jgi:hypothetical protein
MRIDFCQNISKTSHTNNLQPNLLIKKQSEILEVLIFASDFLHTAKIFLKPERNMIKNL